MLPESTGVKLIEQLQIEEDTRLFGTRDPLYPENASVVTLVDDVNHEGVEAVPEGRRFWERGQQKPSTWFDSITKPPIQTSNLKKPKESSGGGIASGNSPIWAWLGSTETPEDPDSVLEWRIAEESNRAKRQEQTAADLEVFRNVEISFSLKDDIPKADASQPVRLSDISENVPCQQQASGAYLLFRNIKDQYPRLEVSLCWRFANMNWKRMENLRKWQHAGSPPLTDADEENNQDTSQAPPPKSLGKKDMDQILRKICALPPPPKSGVEHCSYFRYRAKCQLCHKLVDIPRKCDWRYVSACT